MGTLDMGDGPRADAAQRTALDRHREWIGSLRTEYDRLSVASEVSDVPSFVEDDAPSGHDSQHTTLIAGLSILTSRLPCAAAWPASRSPMVHKQRMTHRFAVDGWSTSHRSYAVRRRFNCLRSAAACERVLQARSCSSLCSAVAAAARPHGRAWVDTTSWYSSAYSSWSETDRIISIGSARCPLRAHTPAFRGVVSGSRPFSCGKA